MKEILAYITRTWKASGILVLVAVMAWAAPAAAWKITSLSTKPSGEIPDGSKIIVTCSYVKEPLFDLENQHALLIISDNGIVKQSNGITDSDTRGISYNIQGVGSHTIKCKIAVKDPKGKPMLSPEKTVLVNVAGKPVEAGKWPTAPIIVTPGQNQKVIAPVKILVKAFNPNDKNCTDNGVLWLSRQGVGPDKKLSAPLPSKSCQPEGAIWELNLVPGLYRIQAQLINSKYSFKSDYSAWVNFEVVGPK